MNPKNTIARSAARLGLLAIALAATVPAIAQSRITPGGGGAITPLGTQLEYASDHFIVTFKPGTSPAVMNSYMQRFSLTKDTKRSSKYFTVLKLSPVAVQSGVKVQMLVDQMRANPAVAYAELDGVVTPDFVPNDPQFGNQFHHNNSGQTGGTVDADIDSVEAWNGTIGAPEVIVAILDDGVDWQHEDIATSIWMNPGETAGNGIDDDGNGFIDDVRGWDFADGDNDPDGSLSNSHGTHCAGITGATHNNGIGVSGCGSNITIMAVRFYPGPSYFSDFANAIDYAWENGADVISASYNIDGYNQTFLNAVKRAETADVPYVNSAGNNGQQNPPRQALRNEATNVIFVAANDHNDNISWFSNYGTLIDVSAPGEDILSLVPEDAYGLSSGTSMSTPLAAGVLAQIRAMNPTFTARQCLDVLIQTSDSKPQLVSKIPGGRRVNFANAVGSQFIPATLMTATVIMGVHSGGTVNSLLDSDDTYFDVLCDPYASRGSYSVVDLSFDSPVVAGDLTKARFHVESNASTAGVSQFIYIWNWTTNAWDNAGNSRLKVGDTEVDFDIATANLSKYVSNSNEVRIRLHASLAVGRRGVIATSFTYRVDEASLGVAP